MNALTTLPLGPVSTKFAGQKADELSAGIQGGFGRLGYKGKVWTIHHRGASTPIMWPNNAGPMNYVDVVILKAAGVISKTFYDGVFVEGTNDQPHCLSSNGITPDPAAPHKQSTTCALCPKNQWGSQVRQDGTAGKGKACADTKRLAIVPLADIKNDMYGGPMLLRVPAASLQELATFDASMQKHGYPYYAVGVRISFDHNEAYPKFIFEAQRVLTDAEADLVLEHRADPRVDRILAEDSFPAAPPSGTAPALVAPTPAPAPVVAPVVTAPTPVPATTPPAPAVGGFGAAPAAPAPQPAAPKPRQTRVAKAQAAMQAPAPAAAPSAPEVPQGNGFDPQVDADFDAKLEDLMSR